MGNALGNYDNGSRLEYHVHWRIKKSWRSGLDTLCFGFCSRMARVLCDNGEVFTGFGVSGVVVMFMHCLSV